MPGWPGMAGGSADVILNSAKIGGINNASGVFCIGHNSYNTIRGMRLS
jgi:hypothetical protein